MLNVQFRIKVNYTAANPRIGMTCHALAGTQILVVGGGDPRFRWQTGAMSNKDPFEQGLGIFDLRNLIWSISYSVNSPQYVQSDVIQQHYAQIKK